MTTTLNNPLYLGTLNPDALQNPLLNKKSVDKPFQKISNLTSKCDKIQKNITKYQLYLENVLHHSPKTAQIHLLLQIENLEKRLSMRKRQIDNFSFQLFNQINETSEKKLTKYFPSIIFIKSTNGIYSQRKY